MDKYENLIKIVDEREGFLEKMLEERHTTINREDVRFVVARKWNSWYPSYFQVEGGCYAMVTRESTDKDNDPGVIVVDPGFKFLQVLREFGIEPVDIKNIVVTHLHPDHIGGLQEFLTLTSKSHQECNVYLNPTSYAMFQNYQTGNTVMHELMPRQLIKIANYRSKSGSELVRLRSYEAHHREIGQRYRSLSLVFEIQSKLENGIERKYAIGILGDTDGSEEYVPDYVKNFRDVDILCLHVGSFTEKKYGSGYGHLYAPGTLELLENLKRVEAAPIIVLSEFGLEMGTDEQIADAFEPLVKTESWKIPLRIAKVVIESPAENEAKKILAKMFAKSIDKYFLWLDQTTPTAWPFMYEPPPDTTLMQLIEFCLAIGFSLVLTQKKVIYAPFDEDIIDQYKKGTYKVNDALSAECKKELENLKKQAPMISFLEGECPDPRILFSIISRLVLVPPSSEAASLTWEGYFLERFPITSEFMSIKDWDVFLVNKLKEIIEFCSKDLKISEEDFTKLSPKRLRSVLFLGFLMLSESLHVRLPSVGFSVQSAKDLLWEQEHRNRLLGEYRTKHPLFGDAEKSPIYKMYELIKTKYPDSKVVPGDIGIQFKLADEITIHSNFLALKPWLTFKDIKIGEWKGKVTISQSEI